MVWLAAGAVALVGVGIWAAQAAERYYGTHDSPHIVVDEIAGQLITALPVACTWPNLVVAFGFFRLFDSLKPWPAGWVDRRVGGGLGVVLDDVVAGVQAGAATALLVHSGAVEAAMAKLGLG
jgi:phosphatidylglycerophosphatase A